jgi:SHS2 domain-containing protein
MKSFEFLEHTADTIVKGYGDTLEEAFAAVAEGLFAVITDIDTVEPKQEITVRIESIDREGLVVAFLSELILRHEVNRIVARDFSVRFTGRSSLTATGRGEIFDENRHEHGMHVKAVSYHMLEVHESTGDEPCHVQVLLDV